MEREKLPPGNHSSPNNFMQDVNSDEMLRLFAERHSEADPKAREVLKEFMRVVTALATDSRKLQELVALDESWRDSLSDSQVIQHLRALVPGTRKRGRPRVQRNRNSRRA